MELYAFRLDATRRLWILLEACSLLLPRANQSVPAFRMARRLWINGSGTADQRPAPSDMCFMGGGGEISRLYPGSVPIGLCLTGALRAAGDGWRSERP